MPLISKSGNAPLTETARALGFDGWVVDSVDDHHLRAHRAPGQFAESLGIGAWFNDGFFTIERRDGEDIICSRPCLPKTVATTMLASLPVVALRVGPWYQLGAYALVVLTGLLIRLRIDKPRERTMQQLLDSFIRPPIR